MANNISQLAWMADEKGSIFWYNQRWFDYTGTTLAEMAGWGWQKVHHPDHVQRVVEKISDVFRPARSGKTHFPSAAGMAATAGFSRGRFRSAIRRERCCAGSAQTPTSARARNRERKYRGLLEAAPDAMVVVNPAGEIVLLNVQAEKQFGYSRDELVGQKVTNIIPEGFAERLIADGTRSAAEALAQQIGTGIELSGRRKDGSEFPIEIMLSRSKAPRESWYGGDPRYHRAPEVPGASGEDRSGTETFQRRTATNCLCLVPRSSGAAPHGVQLCMFVSRRIITIFLLQEIRSPLSLRHGGAPRT